MIKTIFNIILFLVLSLFILIAVIFGYFFYAVTNIGDLSESQTALTTRIYYGNGELMTSLYEENRILVPISEIPCALQLATISVEDRRFYQHFGIDPISLGRALFSNLRSQQIVEGGSTITQQLAKNLFLDHNRTLSRKIREAILTIHLERKYRKEEILEKYLNTIYYGHAAYGVEAASQTYFGKPVQELTLAESAMLAGLPRGPLYYSPYLNIDSAKQRRKLVLQLMEQEGYITALERKTAESEEIKLRGLKGEENKPLYFINFLIKKIPDIFEDCEEYLCRRGLNIYTTLDPDLQITAEQVLDQNLPVTREDNDGVRQPQGALIALDPRTGHIKAMVGGRNFNETNLNRATDSLRSPGSTFKPIIYAAAMENGYTAASRILCEPISLEVPGHEPYEPKDFDGGYHYRYLTLREAIKVSCNVSAVKVNADIGPEKGVEMANRLGINRKLGAYYSLPLGTEEVSLLEMASAYIPLANRGIKIEPVLIEKITDQNDLILWENQLRLEKVLDERISYIITDILQDVARPGGTGEIAAKIINRPVALKTGTSQQTKNAYAIGYTPSLLTAVYVGDDHEKPLSYSASKIAAPIWAYFMSAALKEKAPENFTRPRGITEVTICPETGLRQHNNCRAEGYKEIFIEGTAPTKDCSSVNCPQISPETPRWPSWWPFQKNSE